MKPNTLLAALLLASAMAFFTLGFTAHSNAAPKQNIPFPNAAQQRIDIVNELKVISSLLREQNKLLKEQTNLLKQISARTR